MKSVALGEIAELNPRPTRILRDNELVSFLPMAAIGEEGGGVIAEEQRRYGEVKKGYTPFKRGDLLLAKITPCFENGKVAIATISRDVGFGTTEFHVIRPDVSRVDPRYLFHFLRTPQFRDAGASRMTGAGGQRRVPVAYLSEGKVPLPPLEEQRRIADLLNQADRLLIIRQLALAGLDRLRASAFQECFGSEPGRRWPAFKVSELLTQPLRNGVSPSSRGSVIGRVLTLSAITGPTFRSDALKEGTFERQLATTDQVTEGDLLICRGNGNPHLVGRGRFPYGNMLGVAFPDTMIAARLDERVLPAFVEHIWNSTLVRTQIEALARTTNGTYKVNQTMIESIVLPVPPLKLQEQFQREAAKLDKIAERMLQAEGRLKQLRDATTTMCFAL